MNKPMGNKRNSQTDNMCEKYTVLFSPFSHLQVWEVDHGDQHPAAEPDLVLHDLHEQPSLHGRLHAALQLDLRQCHVQDRWRHVLPGHLQLSPLFDSADLWPTPCSRVLLERSTDEESQLCQDLLCGGVAGQHSGMCQADDPSHHIHSFIWKHKLLWWIPSSLTSLFTVEGSRILPAALSFLALSSGCYHLLLR